MTQDNIKKLSLEETLELFWNVPETFIFSNDPKVKSRYQSYLETKHDKDVLEQQERLVQKIVHLNHLVSMDESYYPILRDAIRNAYDFLYSNDLQNDISPRVIIRQRNTFEMIQNHLLNIPKNFSLVDLGCGDGRLAIALAMNIDKLTDLVLIDDSKEAMKQVEKTLEMADSRGYNLNSRIRRLSGDYHSQKTIEDFKRQMTQGTDVALLAFPTCYFQDLPRAVEFVKDSGETLLCLEESRISSETLIELDKEVKYSMGIINKKYSIDKKVSSVNEELSIISYDIKLNE